MDAADLHGAVNVQIAVETTDAANVDGSADAGAGDDDHNGDDDDDNKKDNNEDDEDEGGDYSDDEEELTSMYIKLDNFGDNEHITFPLVLIEGIIFVPRSDASSRIESIQAGIRGESAATHLSWPVVPNLGHFKVFVMLPRPGDYCIELIVRGEVVREVPVRYTRPVTKHFARFHYEKQSGDSRGFDAPAGVDNSDAAALKRIQLGALLTQTCIAELFYNWGFPRATIALEFDELAECEMPLVNLLETAESTNGGLIEAISDMLDLQNIAAAENGVSLSHFVSVGSNHYDPETRHVANHCAHMFNSIFLFSSVTLHTWPSALSEITRCILDNTPVDTSVLNNDSGGRDGYWANFATGMGVFIHLFFNWFSPIPSTRGILGRGFDNVNRMLGVYEPSSKSKEPAFSTRDDGTLALNHSALEPISVDLHGAYVEDYILEVLFERCAFVSCANKLPQAAAASAA